MGRRTLKKKLPDGKKSREEPGYCVGGGGGTIEGTIEFRQLKLVHVSNLHAVGSFFVSVKMCLIRLH